MREETIVYFSEKEEEFVSLLTGTGMKPSIAKTLVFLSHIPEATSRDIERGTDLRQPEVSLAIRYMAGLGWVKNEMIPSKKMGKPNQLYSLAMPVQKILEAVETMVRQKAEDRMALVRKMRSFA